MTRVTSHPHNHVTVVEFSNPPANYLDGRMLGQLADAMADAASAGARAIVLGATGRHFCAGADFSSIGESPEDRAAVAQAIYSAGLRLIEQPLPIVAAVQGAAVGGGLGLACVADFRVVTRSSRLEANFSRLGFHPGFGLSVTLPRLVGHQRTAELLFTSRRVRGAEAVDIGLADRLADEQGVAECAVGFAEEIADAAPLAVQSIRQTQRGALQEQIRDVLSRELSEQRRLWATEDAATGISAAREKRTPVFTGR